MESNYPNLLEAVAQGDLAKIKVESKVTFKNKKTGEPHFDKKRWDERNDKYFWYGKNSKLTGPVRPPLTNFSKPIVNVLQPSVGLNIPKAHNF